MNWKHLQETYGIRVTDPIPLFKCLSKRVCRRPGDDEAKRNRAETRVERMFKAYLVIHKEYRRILDFIGDGTINKDN